MTTVMPHRSSSSLPPSLIHSYLIYPAKSAPQQEENRSFFIGNLWELHAVISLSSVCDQNNSRLIRDEGLQCCSQWPAAV